MSFVLGVAICFVAALSPGCGEREGDRIADRTFTKVVQCEGRPVLRIDCEYVGKRPGDPDSYRTNHDYRKVDTDFCRITMENLTDDDIGIDGVTYRLEDGPVHGAQSASADSIKRTWGTNIIPARSKVSRANNMVWSKPAQNTLIKTYSFRIPTTGDGQKTFTAEVPLVYNR